MNCVCVRSLGRPGLGFGHFLELGAARSLCSNPAPAGIGLLKAHFPNLSQ